MKTILLFSMVFCVAIAAAQNTLQDQIASLKSDLSKPPTEWTDEFVQVTFQKYVDLYMEWLLWDDAVHAKVKSHLPDKRPKVRVTVNLELRTPYVTEDEIVVPVSYLRYLISIAMLVGHDVYSEDHDIHMGRPLLTTPFRKSAILPLLAPPIHTAVDLEGFNALQPYLTCPQQNQLCQAVQGQAVLAAILFTVLHELSHTLLHHVVSEEGVNVDQEIAADRNAYFVLLQFTSEYKDFNEGLRKEMKRALELTPIVWLEMESSREGIANVVAKAREAALLGQFNGEERDNISDFIQTEASERNILHLQITANAMPLRVLIDGVEFKPSDVIGKELSVVSMKHVIVALRPGEIALAALDAYDTNGHIRLLFQPLPKLDPKEIELAEHGRKWADLLVRTTNDQLQPKDAGVAFVHWEALHRLGLNACLMVNDWNSIPNSEWERVLQWQRSGEPLASWY